MQRKYGWKPDVPNLSDHTYAIARESIANLPLEVDLRPKFKPCYDQLDTNSCTANGIAGAFEYELTKQGLPDFMPSRLFIYFNERMEEGDVDDDDGAQIRTGIKVINEYGVCSEDIWSFDTRKVTVKPDPDCYAQAIKHRSLQYQRVIQDINQIKAVLAQGYAIVFGMAVYASFESDEVAKTGILPMPAPNEEFEGGHCVLAAGYLQNNKVIVRNSYGTSWGQNGYFLMDFDYILNPNLCDDLWVIKLVN